MSFRWLLYDFLWSFWLVLVVIYEGDINGCKDDGTERLELSIEERTKT